jgi:hypothetical protein
VQRRRNQVFYKANRAPDGSALYVFSINRRIFRGSYICDGHYRSASISSIRLGGRTIPLRRYGQKQIIAKQKAAHRAVQMTS